MNADIYLVGIGQTSFGEHWDLSLRDLMDEAIENAIENSPCTSLDIDMVIVANMLAEFTNSQAHLGALASELLPHHPPALRVESACASGAIALHTATALLESGRAQSVLVVGVEKMTDVSPDVISAGLMGAANAETDSHVGLTFPGIFGLIARRYMHDYGLTRDDLSLVSAVHHENARKNPYAQFKREISKEAVSASTPIADPLRLLDCSPISDGAAAVILSTKHKNDLRLAASQIATDSLSLADRASLTTFPATKEAVARAWQEADIRTEDISHLETHDCFSIAAIINVEDLGFAAPGKGIGLYKAKETPVTVNKSGGLKACGHPVAATGVKQLSDIAKQLQASGKRYGLAHNFGGAAASSAIHILEYTHAT